MNTTLTPNYQTPAFTIGLPTAGISPQISAISPAQLYIQSYQHSYLEQSIEQLIAESRRSESNKKSLEQQREIEKSRIKEVRRALQNQLEQEIDRSDKIQQQLQYQKQIEEARQSEIERALAQKIARQNSAISSCPVNIMSQPYSATSIHAQQIAQVQYAQALAQAQSQAQAVAQALANQISSSCVSQSPWSISSTDPRLAGIYR